MPPIKLLFQCFEEAGGEWKLLKTCVGGTEGKQLQLQAEQTTKEIAKPKLKNVPTVVFNNVNYTFPIYLPFFLFFLLIIP